MSRSPQRLLCGAGLAGFRTRVPEERRYERLKGSLWPGAGSLSFFYPPDNNSDKKTVSFASSFLRFALGRNPDSHFWSQKINIQKVGTND